MGPCRVGDVCYADIARVKPVLSELPDAVLSGEVERSQEPRDAVCLRHKSAAGVREAGRVVEYLVDDRALARPPERNERLLRGRDEGTLDYVQSELVYPGHYLTCITRFPNLSTFILSPRRSIVVDVGSSIIAGPLIAAPALSPSLSWTPTERRPSSPTIIREPSRPFRTPPGAHLLIPGLFTLPRAVRCALTTSSGSARVKSYCFLCRLWNFLPIVERRSPSPPFPPTGTGVGTVCSCPTYLISKVASNLTSFLSMPSSSICL